jgi:hypothetical protein
MKQELELQLVKKYPSLFRDYGGDMMKTCMAWGCECGDGWFKILDNLCENLSKYPDVVLAQVKEKFGTLRVYIDCSDENYNEVQKLIDTAETLSGETCEICGSPAKLDSDSYWWTTICDECKSKKRKT